VEDLSGAGDGRALNKRDDAELEEIRVEKVAVVVEAESEVRSCWALNLLMLICETLQSFL
jgi:hypothetical protein